ncbi:MAG: PmoA family protein, partial [Bacteroidota bacterium]|nr:PmoA family protein [Bacteroidota bacterium]
MTDPKNRNLTVKFIKREAEQRVDVMIDGKKFTSYWWPDSVMKPILYPMFSPGGAEITRGFPIKSRPGERTDHPHQVGMWLNYGDVNGIDFWGNSYAIP